MAVGAYTWPINSVSTHTYYGNGWTVAKQVKSSADVIIKSILLSFHQAGTFNGKVVLYRVSDGVKVAESATQNFSAAINTQYEVAFATPFTMLANVDYRMGFFGGSGGGYPGIRNYFFSMPYTVQSSPTNVATLTQSVQGIFNGSGDVYPTGTATSYELSNLGASFDLPNVVPTAPTNLNAQDAQYGTAVPVSWTHNDPDGNPQSKYQIRWRLVD